MLLMVILQKQHDLFLFQIQASTETILSPTWSKPLGSGHGSLGRHWWELLLLQLWQGSAVGCAVARGGSSRKKGNHSSWKKMITTACCIRAMCEQPRKQWGHKVLPHFTYVSVKTVPTILV